VIETPSSMAPIIVAGVLFKRPHLEGIAAGTIDLAFRRWERARVRPGTRLRTAIGVIAIDSVEVVEAVSEEDARRAGFESPAAVLHALRGDGALHRIELHVDGPDPRVALREAEPTPDVFRRLERMGPWAYDYLRAIAERPGVRAPDLAASFGRETRPFKTDVRKLKELGLTESLPIGYRLSPRGRKVLEMREARRAPGLS
jgi:hypothetical protein